MGLQGEPCRRAGLRCERALRACVPVSVCFWASVRPCAPPGAERSGAGRSGAAMGTRLRPAALWGAALAVAGGAAVAAWAWARLRSRAAPAAARPTAAAVDQVPGPGRGSGRGRRVGERRRSRPGPLGGAAPPPPASVRPGPRAAAGRAGRGRSLRFPPPLPAVGPGPAGVPGLPSSPSSPRSGFCCSPRTGADRPPPVSLSPAKLRAAWLSLLPLALQGRGHGKQILVLGLDGAGKTSILHSLATNHVKRSVAPTEGFNAICVNTEESQMEFLESE